MILQWKVLEPKLLSFQVKKVLLLIIELNKLMRFQLEALFNIMKKQVVKTFHEKQQKFFYPSFKIIMFL